MSNPPERGDLPPPADVPPAYLYKVPARRHLLVGVGLSTAEDWSDIIGVPDGIVFNAEHPLVDRIIDRYFALSVVGFKTRHKFPEGERINNAKIAALLVRRCLDDGSKRLFTLAPDLDRPGRVDMVHGDFLFRLLLATVEANPGSVKAAIPKVGERTLLEKEVRYCLTHDQAISEEWLAVVALQFAIHYGSLKSAVD